MADEIFDRETLLDLTVNVIPLGMLVFFIVLFLAVDPFGNAPVMTTFQFFLVGHMLVALFLLTYVAGRVISTAENELEAREDVTLDPHEDGH